MIDSVIRRGALALTLVALAAAPRADAQATKFYVADGDHNTMSVIQNGQIIQTFAIPFLGYPMSVRDTIWLGHRDDAGANEFTLGGVATGNTSAGGNAFSQLLDGTTNGVNNFGVECCGSTNSVTIANLDWSNQQVLFNLSDNGAGIAFDPTSNHLFVGTFSNTLLEYDLTGNLVNTFGFGGGSLASLAYEAATDTLWSARGRQMWQMDKQGNVLNTFTLNGDLGNNWGGEMQFNPTVVPEASSLALFAGALAPGLFFFRRRQRK